MNNIYIQAIKKIPRYSRDILVITYYKMHSLFFNNKDKFRNAWLVCERGIEAKDNGYTFFKYVRENYPDQKIFYLIDSCQKDDYQRVKNLGNIIEYDSYEHKMSLFFASHLISTHVGFITPWSTVLYKILFQKKKRPKFVLLNHGITKEDMSSKLNKKMTGTDLFIAATKKEWETIVYNKSYGYSEKDVTLTGYARYDNWASFQTKRQIVFMPTWRNYLIDRKINDKNNPKIKSSFLESKYFQYLNGFLNNKKLHSLLKENDLTMVFYPHYEMQSSLHLFNISSDRIILANKGTHNIPDLLKESLMMITDYSGVGFDFAYMYKPLIYYQFDQEEYYERHYLKGDFDMEKDGLGQVVTMEDQLIEAIKNIIKNDFQIDEEYRKRIDNMFTYHDNKNSERIYQAIMLLNKDKLS